ncbi:MAG: DNA mismatch repair protein MutS [Acidobacteriota bacterium]
MLQRRENQHARMSAVRLIIAGCAVAVLIAGGLRGLPWLLIPLATFVIAAIIHARVLNARDRAASAVAFYERGLARIRHQWIGQGRSGDGHRPTDHIFADDLDLFGRGSLFELLATTRTRAGEEVLTRWLLTPAGGEESRARQEAVRELAGRLDLREAVAVLGDQVRTAVDAPVLRRWSQSPIRLAGRGWRIGIAALVTTTAAVLVVWAPTARFGWLVWTSLLAQVAVAVFLRVRVAAVVAAVDEPAHDLDVLAELLRVLERERFTSPRLEALRDSLGGRQRASTAIARLSRLVALLESSHNFLFALPAALVMWTTQWAFAIEAWRAESGVHIPEWLDAVGEFETLLALGAFAAEHPNYRFPEIVDGPPVLVATNIAHPALPPEAVSNDVELRRDGLQLLIVSGSNMSGKSTWLRALGTTVVLSWMGAPVRAATCRMSPMAIGASIRVQDSLTDGRSRFFAEITRLKAIVDLVRATDGAALFLLDEILSGTNSHDRRVGAEALLTGLVQAGAVGLVTTHDLALAAIADRLSAVATNAHFADQFTEGVLHFDYTLRPGLVETSNALALMRSIGLEV